MKATEGGKDLGHYPPGTVWVDVDDLVFCLFSEAVLLCSPGWPQQSFYLSLLSSEAYEGEVAGQVPSWHCLGVSMRIRSQNWGCEFAVWLR